MLVDTVSVPTPLPLLGVLGARVEAKSGASGTVRSKSCCCYRLANFCIYVEALREISFNAI